jgi:hypothetical protein
MSFVSRQGSEYGGDRRTPGTSMANASAQERDWSLNAYEVVRANLCFGKPTPE